MQTTEQTKDREALERAQGRKPSSNDARAILAFSARGIPEAEIVTFGPGQNVFTYRAWRALGRQVRRGEHGVKLTVWRHTDHEPEDADNSNGRNGNGSRKRRKCWPVTAVVFHVSQTDPVGNGKGDA